MNVGMNIFSGISLEKQIECFKKLGIQRTFISSEEADFDHVMQLFNKNGIICEALHAPYNRINDMWGEEKEAANQMLNRLKDSVDKCAKYNIPVSIVHLSSGRPMPEINQHGLKRFEELFDYAVEKGVTIALENQRYLENLLYFMNHYRSPGFCWDTGHEYGACKGVRFMDLFGERLVALHINDNRCGDDTDDHLLPFDGKIDFKTVAKSLAKNLNGCTIMLEVGKDAKIDGKMFYGDLSDEEYIERAQNAVLKIAKMTEKYKKEM